MLCLFPTPRSDDVGLFSRKIHTWAQLWTATERKGFANLKYTRDPALVDDSTDL